MILGGDERTGSGHTTLDDLFRRAGVRHPDALALVDPPNRDAVTGGAPRQLTFAEADRAISAFAAKLLSLGLRADSVIALQLGNTVESVIALLGVLRAGMIAVPVPLLWREQDMIEGLGYVGAKAIITSTRIGSYAHAEMTMRVAAELFPIRYICAFGSEVGDGIVPLDDIFTTTKVSNAAPAVRSGNSAAHVAVVTFDIGAKGLIPVARNHQQLIAGGLSAFLESGSAADTTILSTIPIASFAGLALTLMPWLLGGGTLHLHHGFDAEVFTQQCAALNADTLVIPGPAITPLFDAEILNRGETIVALWRSPERLASAASWVGEAKFVDIANFGESGLIAAKRASDGMPSSIPLGRIGNPRGAAGTVKTIETTRLKNGKLALRGSMVPSHVFPPGAEKSSLPYLVIDEGGFVDTGFSCGIDLERKTLTISSGPGGFTVIGGYAFRPGIIEATVGESDPEAMIVAIPDAILGQRLAGRATDRTSMETNLRARGMNPLIAGAFQPRKTASA